MTLMKNLIHKRISLVVLTIILSILVILISLWWNSCISLMIDCINHKEKISLSMIQTSALTIIISSVFAYILSLLSGWTCETIVYDLRMGYAHYLNSLTIHQIEELNSGEQLSKLQNEITDVSVYLRSNLFSIIDDGIRFLATFLWMLFLNPRLTLLAHLPLVFILCYIILSSKIIERAVYKSQETNGQICRSIDTLLTLFPILKIYNATKLIVESYNTTLFQWEALSIKEERTRAKLMSLSGLFSTIPLLLLFFVGGAQVIHGSLSLGILYIFINLSGNVSGILMNLPGRISALRRFKANMNRLQNSVQLIERR